jgi:sulfoxide reductase catalytic subunit YedY
MLIKTNANGYSCASESEVTDRAAYDNRRDILKRMATGVVGGVLASWSSRQAMAQSVVAQRPGKLPILTGRASTVLGASTMEKLTAYKDASSYNNFYEFGTDKSDPIANAHTLKTSPWNVDIEGLVKKPGRLGSAKYVEFVTLADPKTMPYLGSRVLDWPYVEALRLDEALHPLTLLAFGMYGEILPNQSGAPVRLVVPWKYGFKSSKSIVKIRFTDRQPATAWNKAAANEYGFYSNVNPNVDHPRWSQASERRIGEDGLFAKKRKTLMFNGYEAQVAKLYAGMDLKKFF